MLTKKALEYNIDSFADQAMAFPELMYPGTTPSSRHEHQRVTTLEAFDMGIVILESL
jgi:hypothetical protein